MKESNHLRIGIIPSIFNFGRVTGIWMRYGKHKNELNPFGGLKSKSSPLEQFHKHACLQLSIGPNGLSIGMFHSVANEAVDRSHVSDHWPNKKQEIKAIYNQLLGHDFVWTIYDNQHNQLIAQFALDEHSADEFIHFYDRNDKIGYESFCMKAYAPEDPRIKTYKGILNEISATFTAIMPLYNVMTYRNIQLINI